MVVVLAARPKGATVDTVPAGVLVEAESVEAAVEAAKAWAGSNQEWEFGFRVFSVFPFTGRDDLGDEDAVLVRVNFPTDSSEVRDAMRRETELLDAARRDRMFRKQGYWSTEQIQVLERQRAHGRRRRFWGLFRGAGREH